MRVAIVAGPYTPIPPIQYGGIEQVIHYLIKGLLSEGHEPILLGPANSVVDCELIPTIDRPVGFPKTKPQVALANRRIGVYKRRTFNALEKLLPNIDIIHSHGFDLTGFEDFPNVTTVHNAVTFDDIDYFKQRLGLHYIAISKNQKLAFPNMSWVGYVYDGEDPSEFVPAKRQQNYVCFLGRLDQDKNPHMAIELAIKLGIKIKVAGKVDHHGRRYFNSIIKPYLKHPLVEYLGELDFSQKIKLLKYAKCNLHPTGFREPFGLTIIEAAFVGTPTLAITKGSIPELIEDGKTGILVEDFIEAYSQLNKCLEMDRDYIARRAKKLFSNSRMAKNYLKIYKQTIKESRKQIKSN